MQFKDKIVVITGGAKGIGRSLVDSFRKEGAKVCTFDILDNDYFVGNLANKSDIEAFVKKVISEYDYLDILVNNALPAMHGLDDCSWEDFNQALMVGVTAPFYLTKLFKPYFRDGASVINISSTRSLMSQAQTESYSAAKGGISALTHSLSMSLAGKVRVNTVSPGWIDTNFTAYTGADASQHPVRRVGNPLDIVNTVFFLCSDSASFITAENITVDGGMTKQMIYSGDHGWHYQQD